MHNSEYEQEHASRHSLLFGAVSTDKKFNALSYIQAQRLDPSVSDVRILHHVLNEGSAFTASYSRSKALIRTLFPESLSSEIKLDGVEFLAKVLAAHPDNQVADVPSYST